MMELSTRSGGGTVDRTIVTCRDAAGQLNAQWTAEMNRAGTIFGRRIFPDARTDALARAELLAALPAAHDFLIGASRSAADIMRQQMVLNAVHDAGEQWAAEAGNAAALRAYTEARAEAQTVSAYRAIGRQAETWVPLLKIVFECLYIGAFPMAVLLMLTPAGAAIFRSYVTGLIWLQSWGPLYAILHRISNRQEDRTMLHINRVTLLGHAGRDPDIRTLPDGGRAATFSLATTERWKRDDGEAAEPHRVATTWGSGWSTPASPRWRRSATGA